MTVYRLPDPPFERVTQLWDHKGRMWQRKPWPFYPDGRPAEPGKSWIWEHRGLRLRFEALLVQTGCLVDTETNDTGPVEEATP